MSSYLLQPFFVLIICLFTISATFSVRWLEDGKCISDISHSLFTEQTDASVPLKFLEKYENVSHPVCTGWCTYHRENDIKCRYVSYDDDTRECKLWAAGGSSGLDHYYTIDAKLDDQATLRTNECPFYAECTYDDFCRESDCSDKGNVSCVCPKGLRGRLCDQDLTHQPVLVQTIPNIYTWDVQHMTVRGKHYLITAGTTDPAQNVALNGKVFIYDETVEKYIHMQYLPARYSYSIDTFASKGDYFLVVSSYVDYTGIPGGAASNWAWTYPTDNTVFKFYDPVETYPYLMGVDEDKYVRYLRNPGDAWEKYTSEICCVTSMTVADNGAIYAMTTDYQVITRPSLDSIWSIKMPSSCCVTHISTRPDGTFLGVGTNQNLYFMESKEGTWNVNQESCCVKAAVETKDYILAIDTSGNLVYKKNYTESWKRVANGYVELGLKDVTVDPDGIIYALRTDGYVLMRKRLEFPWTLIPNSCCVIDIDATGGVRSFDLEDRELLTDTNNIEVPGAWGNAADLSNCGRQKARTLNPADQTYSWCAATNDYNQFVTLGFDEIYNISKVATQGQGVNAERVELYELHFSTDNSNFDCHRTSATAACTQFVGNKATTQTVITNFLDPPILAKYLKFVVLKWNAHISLRAQAYGRKPSQFIGHQNITQFGMRSTKVFKRDSGDIVMMLGQKYKITHHRGHSYIYSWDADKQIFVNVALLPTEDQVSGTFFEDTGTLYNVAVQHDGESGYTNLDSKVFTLNETTVTPPGVEFIGNEITVPTATDSSTNVIIVDVDTQILEDGEIVGWQYYASNSGHALHFYLLREADAACKFTVVGKTLISRVMSAGYREHLLSIGERLQVKAGDYIGIGWPSTQTVGYDANAASAPSLCGGSANPATGDVVTLSDYGSKYYSFRAMWTPISVLAESVSALGMESGAIPNSAITASWSHADCSPHPPGNSARLNYKDPNESRKGDAWCGGQTNPGGFWLQIDLGDFYIVTKTATQGRTNNAQWSGDQWVTSFKLYYSSDGSNFECYKDDDTCTNLVANSDKINTVYQELAKPFQAKSVRFYPMTWYNYASMRVEVYGYMPGWSELNDISGTNLKGNYVDTITFNGTLYMVISFETTAKLKVFTWNTGSQTFTEMQEITYNSLKFQARFFTASGKLFLAAADDGATDSPIYVLDGNQFTQHVEIKGRYLLAVCPFTRNRDTFLFAQDYKSDIYNDAAREYIGKGYMYKWT